ncbi:MAG: N-acetyltransferase [Clostridia bacterium]|nr:N-acetyltransferase [Clostridia bacterium]
MSRLTPEDFTKLRGILQDESVMYAWEHAFSDQEVRDWISRNMERYVRDGYGYFAAVDKATGEMVGNIGLLREEILGKTCIGVGYILRRNCWGRGYAAEGARGCIGYARNVLHVREVIADIRPENRPSRRVAESLGMTLTGEYDKPYRGKLLPHLIYKLEL